MREDFLICFQVATTSDEFHSNPAKAHVPRDQGEIIEIAFTVVNVSLIRVIHKQQILVRPENTTMSPFCSKIVGLDASSLENAGNVKQC